MPEPLLRRLPPGLLTGIACSEVTRAWAGRTIVCIASGPSLTAAQVDVVRAARRADRVRVIAINDNYIVAPCADVCYFADFKWHEWHKDRAAWRSFAGLKVSLLAGGWVGQAVPPELHMLRHGPAEGLSAQPGLLAGGSNSGHQALNLAVLSGARCIALLGYDGQRGPDGRKHHFGDHPDRSEPPYRKQLAALRTVAADARALGVRIVNCSPGSAIEGFERGAIASLLPDPAAAALPG